VYVGVTWCVGGIWSVSLLDLVWWGGFGCGCGCGLCVASA